MCVDNDRGDMTHDTQSRSLCLTQSPGGGGGPAVASCVASILRLPAPPTAAAWPIMSCIRLINCHHSQAKHTMSPQSCPQRVQQSGICFVDRTMDSGQITRMHNGNNQRQILTMFVANIEWQKQSDKDQNTPRKCG